MYINTEHNRSCFLLVFCLQQENMGGNYIYCSANTLRNLNSHLGIIYNTVCLSKNISFRFRIYWLFDLLMQLQCQSVCLPVDLSATYIYLFIYYYFTWLVYQSFAWPRSYRPNKQSDNSTNQSTYNSNFKISKVNFINMRLYYFQRWNYISC